MNRIINFLEKAIELEAKVRNLRRRPDIAEFNNALDEWNKHTQSTVMSFGVQKMKKPYPEAVYEDLSKQEPYKPRTLYKLEKYNHSKFGDLYVAYTNNGLSTVLDLIYEGLFIADFNGALKIYFATNYGISRKQGKEVWRNVTSDDLDMKTLGKPVEVIRLIEPELDKHLYEADGFDLSDIEDFDFYG